MADGIIMNSGVRLKEKIPGMTEEQAKAKVDKVEEEADTSLAIWESYQ